ncbi:DegT/DnrJ/EryC1/StrS family aminotransferase [Bacteroidia bacterium]|jgi:perosamine synthetase|nr:DegT/DnrJ/EryC1/StrS family aminotransferase [Bacteroidia bacterium]
MDIKINFSGTGHRYTQEEIDLVGRVMNEADPLTQGKYRNEFEEKFKNKMGLKHCFAVHTATAALELTAQLCQFNGEDELIVPSHTYTSSVFPFVKKGAQIKWCDIDLETRVVSAKEIVPHITDKTKAILIPHIYGYMTEMQPIMDLAKKHNLLVIEDVAQAMGTETNGIKAGAYGDFGIYSFHSHKNITTLGEGGMLALKDDAMAKILPAVRHNGHCPWDFKQSDYWVPAGISVDLPVLNGEYVQPNNYCLGEVECALGIKLLDRLDEINDKKRERAMRFIDGLKDYPEIEMHQVNDKRHNYHLLVSRITNGKSYDVIRKMAYEKGIKCVVQYYPLHRYDYYKKSGFGFADVPNTDEFYDNMVSFPFQHWMSEEDMDYMLTSIKEVLNDLRNN